MGLLGFFFFFGGCCRVCVVVGWCTSGCLSTSGCWREEFYIILLSSLYYFVKLYVKIKFGI